MEVRILGDDHETIGTGVIPDQRIGSFLEAHISDVLTSRVNVIQGSH
jgi:hypothetical protein